MKVLKYHYTRFNSLRVEFHPEGFYFGVADIVTKAFLKNEDLEEFISILQNPNSGKLKFTIITE